MNKPELVRAVSEKAQTSHKDAAAIVDAVFAAVGDSLAKGEDVSIIGFGTFSTRERAARSGLNPRTRETITIAASKSPVFKPGKGLRDRVSGSGS